jgi:endonuclease/exonuclease/phosphatase family metal-dependent hydrolase
MGKLKKALEESLPPITLSVKEVKSSLTLKEPVLFELLEERMLRVMSFNVKWDDEKEDPNHLWKKRRNQVASVIRFHKVDLAGLQEPFKRQMDDLSTLLPEYGWIGTGLEDGEIKGPMDAIMYRKSRFALLEESHFYLSQTPEKPSTGWDAKFPRGVTWAKLYDKKTKKRFYVFNTHFDYHGHSAREESAFLLKQKIAEIAKDAPFIVTGDFNLFPEMGGKEVYETLTQGNEEIEGRLLRDAHFSALYPHHGPTGSWSGFKEAGQPGIKPDYIFVGANLDVITHGILADCFDGRFPSDHLPIVADLVLR